MLYATWGVLKTRVMTKFAEQGEGSMWLVTYSLHTTAWLMANVFCLHTCFEQNMLRGEGHADF